MNICYKTVFQFSKCGKYSVLVSLENKRHILVLFCVILFKFMSMYHENYFWMFCHNSDMEILWCPNIVSFMIHHVIDKTLVKSRFRIIIMESTKGSCECTNMCIPQNPHIQIPNKSTQPIVKDIFQHSVQQYMYQFIII